MVWISVDPLSGTAGGSGCFWTSFSYSAEVLHLTSGQSTCEKTRHNTAVAPLSLRGCVLLHHVVVKIRPVDRILRFWQFGLLQAKRRKFGSGFSLMLHTAYRVSGKSVAGARGKYRKSGKCARQNGKCGFQDDWLSRGMACVFWRPWS